MKHILITTIAAVLLVGCGESQQSAPTPEATPVEPVAEAATPEPPTAKAPDISIHDAAKGGNIEVVIQHVAAGVDVNAKSEDKDGNGGTPLCYAAWHGRKEIAELLIAEGADVNAAAIFDRYTPLHYAVSSGHTEIAELLIDAGADLEAKNPAVGTPLLFAVLQGHKEVVELLIAEGADVNAKDIADRTPVDVAIRYKLTEIADLLRKHGGKTAEELKAEGK
jgi:ankyrin repeat protein